MEFWMQSASFLAAHRTMVKVPGGELAHYQVGTGPALVLVHGWPLHSATWRHLVPRLASHATLHMFDMPGAGQSTWANGSPTFRANAVALGQAIKAVGLSSYVLMGHDSGGALARRVAVEDPEVRGLVLMDTEIPHDRSPLLVALLTACKLPFARVAFPWALQRRAFRRSLLGFGSCFTDPAYVDSDFAEHFVAPLRDRRVADAQMKLGLSFDFAYIDELEEVHARITAKTLCIWGERDPYFPVDAARAMVASLPKGTTFATIPDARLFPHEDHPDQVAALVRSFLTELPLVSG
jgi:pimeloyl-ACP methyl ester carboxylesterase